MTPFRFPAAALLVVFGSTHLALAAQSAPAPFEFHVDVQSELFTDLEGQPDFSSSYIGLNYGNSTLSSAISKLGLNRADISCLLNFRLKFSGVPYLVEGMTRDSLLEVLDEKITEIRKAKVIEISQKVEAALAKDPNFPSLPPAMQSQIRSKLQADAEAQLDTQLAGARASRRSDIDKRVDQLKKETMFQEFAIATGKILGDGQALIFLEAGKFKPETGPAVTKDGESALESLSPVNNRIQRGNGVAATGAVGLGYARSLDGGNGAIKAEIFLFHDRLAFISGKDYVGAVASLEPDDYEDHKDIWKLDSTLLRVLLEQRKTDIYVAVGSYSSSDLVIQAGTVYRITPQGEIHADYFRGDRLQLSQGASIYYIHRPRARVSTYIGYERIWDAWQPAHGIDHENERSWVAGMSWKPRWAPLRGSVLSAEGRMRNGKMKPFIGAKASF
jgi:hypothetical protein